MKSLYNKFVDGDMAQLVERLVRNEKASGSNPLISTTMQHRAFSFYAVFIYGYYILDIFFHLFYNLLKRKERSNGKL